MTVWGRPVARLSPAIARPGTMPWRAFSAAINEAAADRDLLDDLQRALPESTDEFALL